MMPRLFKSKFSFIGLFVAFGAYLIGHRSLSNQNIAFSVNVKFDLQPENAISILGDEDSTTIHKINFLLSSEQEQPLLTAKVTSPEGIIRCIDNTDEISDEILNEVRTFRSSTSTCMRVFNEISIFGPPFILKKDAEKFLTQGRKGKLYFPHEFSAIVLNTKGKKGICLTDSENTKTCVPMPSLHLVEFELLPPTITPKDAPRWGSTIGEVMKSIEMTINDKTRIDKVCPESEEVTLVSSWFTFVTANPCKTRTALGLSLFANRLQTIAKRNTEREFTENKCTIFHNATSNVSASFLAKQPVVAVVSPSPGRKNNIIK